MSQDNTHSIFGKYDGSLDSDVELTIDLESSDDENLEFIQERCLPTDVLFNNNAPNEIIYGVIIEKKELKSDENVQKELDSEADYNNNILNDYTISSLKGYNLKSLLQACRQLQKMRISPVLWLYYRCINSVTKQTHKFISFVEFEQGRIKVHHNDKRFYESEIVDFVPIEEFPRHFKKDVDVTEWMIFNTFEVSPDAECFPFQQDHKYAHTFILPSNTYMMNFNTMRMPNRSIKARNISILNTAQMTNYMDIIRGDESELKQVNQLTINCDNGIAFATRNNGKVTVRVCVPQICK